MAAQPGDVSSPLRQWRYAWPLARKAAVFQALLMTWGASIGLIAALAPFGLLGSTLQDRSVRGNFPIWLAVALFLFFFSLFLFCLKEIIDFARKYVTDAERIVQSSVFGRTEIPWSEVTEVNRLIEPTRDIYMAFVNRRGLWIASASAWIIVYEELDGYDAFRALVDRECQAHGVPMFERDSSWEVVGVKGRGLWAKRSERRGRLTRYELHPIDEL